MHEGAVVEDGRGERISTVDEDRAAAERFKHGDGDSVAAAKSCFLYRGLRRGVKVEDKVSLGTVASQDRRVGAGW